MIRVIQSQGALVAAGLGARSGAAQAAATRWNFTVLGADIAFFSLGLSISSAYTVLPLFVHHLTPNNAMVALIPAVRALGLYVPPLLVAPVVERLRRAMPFILVATLLERLPFLFLAGAAVVLSRGHADLLLALLVVMITLAATGSGLTYPAWLDMIARVIPSGRLGRFFGLWTGVGGLLGIGGAALAAAILARVVFPENFALCFLLTFGAYVISFVLLTLGREPPRVHVTPRESTAAGNWTLARTRALALWQVLRNDRDLLRLIASNGLAGIATMAGALYAVSAVRLGHLSDAQVGVENTVLFVAMTGGYFLWGTIGDHFGHRAVLIYGSACAALAAAAALVAHDVWMYGLVFLLLGLNLAATSLAGLTFITEFGPEARRPTYIALASVAYAPFAIGAPIAGGFLADAWGYWPAFVISIFTGLAGALAFALWVPDPRHRRQTQLAASDEE
jgi:MFS family permease